MIGRIGAACFALTCGLVLAAGPAAAQQNADEPRIDPIFGSPEAQERQREREEELRPMNDDEFDQPRGWSPLRGFVSVLTYLAPQQTNLSLGVGPEYRPDYFGSDDYEFRPDPQVYIKVRNFVFLDNDGADLALFGVARFALGPSIRLLGDRDEDENAALVGLGDIDRTLELGGFIATTFLNRVQVRAKVRKGVVGGHDGLTVDAAGTVLLFRHGRFSTAAAGQVTWINNSLADTFFTVTPEQSLASGLPEYEADAGFRDIGGSLNGYINVGKRWSLNPYVQYRRIFSDIADTPIISQFGDRNQFTVGMHLMREFQFGGGGR